MIGTAARPKILVVGAGLAGTATAIRLLCFARGPLEVVLLERRDDYRYAGVAYHRDGNPWDHVFNVQAGRMSAFREDVLDFIHWANTEADRSGWPRAVVRRRVRRAGPRAAADLPGLPGRTAGAGRARGAAPASCWWRRTAKPSIWTCARTGST